MFLNNSLIEKGICNGTIGVITDFDKDSHSVQMAFCVQSAIVHCWIQQHTSYFYAAGQRASRTQFPLQNSFALTIHKTQGLTLQKITVSLDHHISDLGKPQHQCIRQNCFHNRFKCSIVKEYERLQRVSQQLSITFPF